MRIHSLNIGRPQLIVRNGRQYSTAINRRSADGPIELTAEGLTGDRVSDLRVHGGPDKAVCCYPREHYALFGELLGRALTVPAFGENFTTDGLLESQVCVGDVWEVGSAVVEVSQPRQPCGKLASKHDEPRLIGWINERAFCGWYVRVRRPGVVAAGDAVAVIERPHPMLTIADLTRWSLDVNAHRKESMAAAECPVLSESWRRQFERKLGGGEEFDE